MNKEERTKTLINNIKLNINEQNVYEFGLCVEQWKQILDYIGELQQENKILRENAEHNDKVVDKVYWENLKLKNQQKEFIEWLTNEKNIYPYDISDYTYEDIINTILSKYYEIIDRR